jgi:hypothetical protein
MEIKQVVHVNLVGQTAQIEAEYSQHSTTITVKTEIKMSAEKPLSVEQLREVPHRIAMNLLKQLPVTLDTPAPQ